MNYAGTFTTKAHGSQHEYMEWRSLRLINTIERAQIRELVLPDVYVLCHLANYKSVRHRSTVRSRLRICILLMMVITRTS